MLFHCAKCCALSVRWATTADNLETAQLLDAIGSQIWRSMQLLGRPDGDIWECLRRRNFPFESDGDV